MKLRKLAGYRNRDDFARKLGVNKYTYRSWESGTTQLSLEHACRLCDHLGCTLDELVGRESSADVAQISEDDQSDLNRFYESMTDSGRTLLTQVAKHMSADPLVQR